MHWSWFRIAAAVIAFSGVVAGFVVNVDRAARGQQHLGVVLANYFSMFTIVSTILSAAALIVAASWSMRHPGTSREPLSVALLSAATAGPVLLLGLVYNMLLRDLPSGVALGDSAGVALLDRYAVEVLHVVIPLYVLADLILAPRTRALPWWSLAVLVGYPVLWTAYTMVRGELVPNPDGSAPWWYPYPFLDPHGAGGYPSAFLYIAAITVAFLAIGAIIVLTTRYRAKRSALRGGTTPAAGLRPA